MSDLIERLKDQCICQTYEGPGEPECVECDSVREIERLRRELAEAEDRLSIALSANHDLRDERDSLIDRLASAERRYLVRVEDHEETIRELAEARSRQTCEGTQPYICHALATARSRLADIESQNRVMWDVANDREARLAEAEALLREARLRADQDLMAVGHLPEGIARSASMADLRKFIARIDAALAADQPEDVVCKCDDHDARYCVSRASRTSPCRCRCHGAGDTAAHSGAATITGTPPTSLTSTDKSEGSV